MGRESVEFDLTGAGWSSLVARRAHNPKVVGSNPAPATRFEKRPLLTQWPFSLCAENLCQQKVSRNQTLALDTPATSCRIRPTDAGWSSLVARRAHNPKVVGSNPAPATRFKKRPLYTQWPFSLPLKMCIASLKFKKLDNQSPSCRMRTSDAGWSSLVARRAHNPKVVGSNPAPATIFVRTNPACVTAARGLSFSPLCFFLASNSLAPSATPWLERACLG